tara:strand:+ start:973 stop:1566 length:594 start_codon:yes stop_codon:yes gene_type:complete
MDKFIEYTNIKYSVDHFQEIYEKLKATSFSTFTECDVHSWLVCSNPDYKNIMEPILSKHRQVHDNICPLATGFNHSPAAVAPYHIPAHIDLDKPLFFNLLLPIEGSARITIYKTVINDLEYRHNKSHFMVPKNDNAELEVVDSIVVDKPVLLNTSVLHRVDILEAPRNVWCTRWIDVSGTYTVDTFKQHMETTLNAA